MLVRVNCSQSVDDLAAAVVVSHGTCYKILTDHLNMSRVTQHNMPRIVTQDQCDDRMTILHIALSFSKRYWQGNGSPFGHTLRTHLISHHAIILSPRMKSLLHKRRFHPAEEV